MKLGWIPYMQQYRVFLFFFFLMTEVSACYILWACWTSQPTTIYRTTHTKPQHHHQQHQIYFSFANVWELYRERERLESYIELKSINSNGLVWLDNFVYFSSSLCKDFFLVSFLIRFFFQPVRLRRRLIDRTFEKKKKRNLLNKEVIFSLLAGGYR